MNRQDGASVCGSPSVSSPAVVNPLLMYNRQTLLDLRLVASDLTNTTYTGHKTLPPFLAGIPANLCRTLAPASRRKRFRRRGKRSGLLVKLKVYLVRSSPAPWNKRGSVPHHPRKIFPHLRRRGANLQNLRPLCRVSQSATNTLTSTRLKKKRKTRRGRRAKCRRAAVSVSNIPSDALQTILIKRMADMLEAIANNLSELADLIKKNKSE
ncbi:hypothetical protein ACER0C_031816 [Sarotherodon galilaeus]